MRTVQPCIIIGSYAWDQDRVPRDEFQIRIGALNQLMDANGWKAVLVYGDAAEHSALAWFSGFTTRLRWGMALIPREGEPTKLVHRIESHHLDSLPGNKLEYSAWQELWQNLETMVKPYHHLTMQYSPNNQIPYISLVDAGMPVVASRAGGVGDTVQSGTTGLLVEPGEPPDLFAAAVLSLVEQAGLRMEMSRAARAFARSQSWDAIMGELRMRYQLAIDATSSAAEPAGVS